jgi:crotonobetainyl-CoA:carnitine CoA-transferase CaiB-like acyl-CoA transferase
LREQDIVATRAVQTRVGNRGHQIGEPSWTPRSLVPLRASPPPGEVPSPASASSNSRTSRRSGLTLAGLGADAIKVEPPGGSPTRRIGPFYGDREDRERSLFFWQYNRGKRSVVLDLDRHDDRERFRSLVATADVLLESTPRGELDARGLSAESLMRQSPALIVARMSPFGDDGPWADFKGSDLVHLALGGVMMNCGYDPAPDGTCDLPPIAPQMWHAFHIAGEQLALSIVAALLFRWRTGMGQRVSCAIHEAVAKSTEVDLMTWVMRRALVLRETCRHARESVTPHPSIVHTKDGRWVMANLGTRPGEAARLVALLEKYGMDAGLDAEKAALPASGRFVPGTGPSTEKRDHAMEAVQRLRAGVHVRERAVARGPGGGHALGAAAEAARKRDGPALARAPELRGRPAPRARPLLSLRDEQMARDGHGVVGGPARAALERGRRARPAPPRARPAGDRRRRTSTGRRGALALAASHFPSTTCASWTSRGSWRRRAARGSSLPSAPRASRSS